MARTLAAVPDLEQELDHLYGGPLEAFTSARNDLTRRLQKAGQSDAAERIRALKKPSVPVWTVNQLARSHGEDVKALVEAGDQLRRAQEQAFGESGGAALRDATAGEREAIRRLTHRAQDVLQEKGRSASRSVLERVASTLRAAAVDPDAAALLVAGRLAGELDSPGFDTVAELAPPAARPRKQSAAAERKRQAERRKLQGRVERLERRADEEESRAARAEEAAAAARERAEQTRAERDAARAELDELA